MRYAIDYSTKNGLGNPAVSLFLSGCDKPIKCKGCHNWELQQNTNIEIDLNLLKKQLTKQLRAFSSFHKTTCLAILGGEPLASYNKDYTVKIATWVKEEFPSCETVLYTYHDLEMLTSEVKDNFDYGVLGPFEFEELNPNYLPGSKNQIIYNFKKNIEMSPIYIGEEKKHAI